MKKSYLLLPAVCLLTFSGCIDKRLEEIVSARQKRARIDPLSCKYGDMPIEKAYKLQDAVTDRLFFSLGPVVGYKVAFASKAVQKKFNINEPACGRLFQKQLVTSGRKIRSSDFKGFMIEPEVAFTISKDVRTKLKSPDEIKKYVRSVHIGFDISEERFNTGVLSPTVSDVIATGCGAENFMIGEAVDSEGVDFEKMKLTLEHDGKQVSEGAANNAMGGPYKSLLWLSNHLLDRGLYLKAGDVVLTGAVAAPYSPGPKRAKGQYIGSGGTKLGGVSVDLE